MQPIRLMIMLVIPAMTIAMFSCQPKQAATKVEVIEEVVIEPEVKYGIVVDSLDEHIDRVKWNQYLSDILSSFNVDDPTIYQIAQASKGVFDVRNLKAERPYSIFLKRDSAKTATHFVFEPDKTEYVVFHLQDSIHVTRHKRPITIEEHTIVAEIENSVYEAVLAQNESPILVSRLVDVFAWQVDFFRIQKGDRFKVIYEVEKVGDEVVGISQIKGAYFQHFGKDYYAINFENDGSENFFDEKGNSLRKTFLKAPLDFYRISSRYNPRRFHPVLKRYKAHLGTDYAAPRGTPIRTVGDGVVLEASYTGGNGNYVKVKHNSNYTTQYLHMSKIASGMRPGTRVKQGQTIGYVGSTGLANGPHVCFRFWKNGRQVDPLRIELPPSEPISEDKRSQFLHTKNVIVSQLFKLTVPSDSLEMSKMASKPADSEDKSF
ncbi:peptidoglycan DD-metalloendopeptidase family protein [Marinoscillum sp. MHG1-6]|uniref:peptidoglycan DD-metalloendopeptidase family protein n=1 Tax=Marinoscillum sp. MHG1-6 TaxID=2959627 RepID=UPI00215882F5|nr:peptidoglycan DD-metalloendopeptidase family protein [Marinoscillum sp. MHG1-6]